MMTEGLSERTYQWAIGALVSILILVGGMHIGSRSEKQVHENLRELIQTHLRSEGHAVTNTQINSVIDRLDRIEGKLDRSLEDR